MSIDDLIGVIEFGTTECRELPCEKIINAINICITEGYNTAEQIDGVLRLVPFEKRRVKAIRKLLTGRDASKHHWYKDTFGEYHFHSDHG